MEKRRLWDFPTRLFHWCLLLSLSGSWITAEAGFDWTQVHFYFGYTALGLVLFRVLWGIFGTTYARFSQFVRSPMRVFEDLRKLGDRTPSLTHGHSASGGWAVMAMLTLVTVQATTGLFVSDDIFYAGPYNPAVSGDLAGRFAYFHHLNFTVLQCFVALHILVIGWYQFRKRENLTAAMISGQKSVSEPLPTSISTPWVRFLLLAGLAAGAIVLLIQLAPEPVYLGF